MSSLHPRRTRISTHTCHSRRWHQNFMVEGLEERVVLSPTIYTVDRTTDSGATVAGSGSGVTGDLRYVIYQADHNSNSDGSTIQFDPTVFAAAQTIALSSDLGTLDLTETAGSAEIDGPTAGVTISGDSAVEVFNVASGVTATLSGLTITAGSASGNGGGLYNYGRLTLDSCTVTGNSAASGGGLFNASAMTLTDCTIAGNSASTSSGGLENQGTMTLTNCTVAADSAPVGGGISNNGGTMTLTNCSIADNTNGGALYNAGAITLNDCTIAGNSATSAIAGLSNTNGTGTLEDTIVGDNTNNAGASDIGGPDANDLTGTYNLIGPGGSGGITNGSDGNIVLTEGSIGTLLLAPLGNYGGPTQTQGLLPGSVAIGAGTGISEITTDQRGIARPTFGPVDIGAFQSQGFTMTLVTGSTPQSAGVGTAFANALAVEVTANDTDEPVLNGVVNFTVDPSDTGAAANLSAATASILSNGQASVIASANSIGGTYSVMASSVGIAGDSDVQPDQSGAPTHDLYRHFNPRRRICRYVALSHQRGQRQYKYRRKHDPV